MRSQQEYVLRTVEERAIRFVQLWFTDVLGTAKTFSITPAELENALEEGMTFDGSAIDGFSRVQESDVLARPDPKTFQLLPWHPDDIPVARVFCDLFNLDGTPFEGCPRHTLRRTLDRARDQGFTFFAAPEIEYFYFADADPGHTPVTLDSGSYFELTASDVASDLRNRTVLTLEEMGIPVEHAQHEDAPSQHEIDLRYTDALTMADTVMTVRLVVKEMAQRHGIHASFMPKPLAGVQGSGMHTHLSLFEGDTNAFYDPTTPTGCRRWPSASWPGCSATPTRSRPSPTSGSTPTSASSPATRRPSTCPGPATTARRSSGSPSSSATRSSRPASSTGPRLGLQPLPGLRRHPGRRAQGHRGGLRTAPRGGRQPLRHDPRGARRRQIRSLPGSLNEAVAEMEHSELMAETLGEHVFEWFIRNKRAEWAAYKTHISQFELDRYFPLL